MFTDWRVSFLLYHTFITRRPKWSAWSCTILHAADASSAPDATPVLHPDAGTGSWTWCSSPLAIESEHGANGRSDTVCSASRWPAAYDQCWTSTRHPGSDRRSATTDRSTAGSAGHATGGQSRASGTGWTWWPTHWTAGCTPSSHSVREQAAESSGTCLCLCFCYPPSHPSA